MHLKFRLIPDTDTRYNHILCLFSSLIPSLFVLITEFVFQGATTGSFFWKPRLGLDLAIPTSSVPPKRVLRPSRHNIIHGYVVLIDGYQAGMTVLAIVVGITSAKVFPQLNPRAAHYYTNAYRWALRYFSLLPFWLGGHGGNYYDTHKTWRRRFFYMDKFVPKWLRKVFFHIKKKDWAFEEWEWRRFKKYSEPAFGRHYRYPHKKFRNFRSEQTQETIENMDGSKISVRG